MDLKEDRKRAYDDLTKALLDKADIVTVISSYLDLTKKGKDYVALCPFHDDKHPSMSISPEKKIFNCFSCHTGGNAITFVQKYKKISYFEAMREVADLVGFDDPLLKSGALKPKIDEKKQELFNTINDLQQFYQYSLNLPEAKAAKDYLEKRNLDDAQVKKYSIGYAITDGAKTIDYLQKKGHSLDKIKRIGIVSSNSNTDANAGRLIFPLKDKNGQVVGFSARKLDNIKGDSPKYINSPKTEIFIKGDNLYNYNNAKETARNDGYIYVLEGFMDVMALDKSGIRSAVALMGTAMTDEQIELLRRLNVEIRLSLDGDVAGQMGMMKIINQFNKKSIPLRLVSNPNDLRDPDEILQESGQETLKKAMNNLVEPFEFIINYYENVQKLTKNDDKKKVLQFCMPFIASIKDALERENCIIKLSKVTNYEPDVLRKLLIEAKDGKPQTFQVNEYSENRQSQLSYSSIESTKLQKAERLFLTHMLKNADSIEFFKTKIGFFITDVYEAIAEYLLDYAKDNGGVMPESLMFSKVDESDDYGNKEELNRLLTDLYSRGNNSIHNETDDELFDVIQKEKLKEKKKLENQERIFQEAASIRKNKNLNN